MQVGFLDFYGGVLDVRDQRSTLIANNIANADTPGYKAVDIPFAAALQAQLQPDEANTTDSGVEYRAGGTVGLSGNDVSLDSERIEASQNGEAMLGATTFLHQSTNDLVMALRPNPNGI
jgi:flagellar basal-body rod protein FlgB